MSVTSVYPLYVMKAGGGGMRFKELISIIKGNDKERVNNNDKISAEEADEIARIVGV